MTALEAAIFVDGTGRTSSGLRTCRKVSGAPFHGSLELHAIHFSHFSNRKGFHFEQAETGALVELLADRLVDGSQWDFGVPPDGETNIVIARGIAQSKGCKLLDTSDLAQTILDFCRRGFGAAEIHELSHPAAYREFP